MTTSTPQAQRLGNFAQPALLPPPHPDAPSPDIADVGNECVCGSRPSHDSHTHIQRPSDGVEILRVIAVGSLNAVNHHIMQMYQLGYAQPHEWSPPLPTANPNEVMRIMTKRLVGGDR